MLRRICDLDKVERGRALYFAIFQSVAHYGIQINMGWFLTNEKNIFVKKKNIYIRTLTISKH